MPPLLSLQLQKTHGERRTYEQRFQFPFLGHQFHPRLQQLALLPGDSYQGSQ